MFVYFNIVFQQSFPILSGWIVKEQQKNTMSD